jgi:hypothetical protein
LEDFMREIILDFARRIIEHERGSNYGQGPDNPMNNPPAELSDKAGYIHRLVMAGHKAAIARSEHDEARASFFHEDVPKMRWLLKDAGVSADELYSIGYKAFGQR